jgi:hypothetical protein
LKRQLADIETRESTPKTEQLAQTVAGELGDAPERKWPLSQEEYSRYGRQMIVPSVGIQGMASTYGKRKSRALILMLWQVNFDSKKLQFLSLGLGVWDAQQQRIWRVQA